MSCKESLSFMIIGAQKAGTTFLNRCIAEHPSVLMPVNEISFFEDPEYSTESFDDFFQRTFPGNRQALLGIKRPTYLYDPNCPQRIALHAPEVKIIAVLRNPVERDVSAFFHYMRMGLSPIISFNRGMKILLNRQGFHRYPRSAQILEYGFYAEGLRRYLKCFGPKRMLIIIYDNLRKEPIKTIERIFSFLGVDEKYLPRGLRMRPKLSVYSLSRLSLLALQSRLIFQYSNDRMRLTRKERLGFIERLAIKGISTFDRFVLFPLFGNGSKPEMDSSLKQRLFDIYRYDIEELELLLGVSLDCWKFGKIISKDSSDKMEQTV